MANIIFLNNSSSLLAASINNLDTTIQVSSGDGSLFPDPSAPQYFVATLEDDAGNIEVVQCTQRVGDLLEVVRGFDNSIAQSFSMTTTRVELRLTAVVMEEFLQLSGGTLSGDLDMDENNILDAIIAGPNTQMIAGEIIGVPLRGDAGDSSNEVVVPTGGGRVTAGGVELLAEGDDLMQFLDVAGVITFTSATVGVVVPAGAYFRVEGPTAANHMNVIHDDTDIIFTFPNTGQVKWDTELNITADIKMSDNALIRPLIDDYSILHQSLVIAGNATTLNYTSGQSAILDLNPATGAVTLTLSNPPASGSYGEFSLKIIQGSPDRDITWPGSFRWPEGTPPVLTTDDNAVDIVAGFTINGGTDWYVTFALDFS